MKFKVTPNTGPRSQVARQLKGGEYATMEDAQRAAVQAALRRDPAAEPLSDDTVRRLWSSLSGAGWTIGAASE